MSKDAHLLSPNYSKTHASFVPKEETGLLQGAGNFKLSVIKLPTPALKAEHYNSGQSELCFPVFAAMHEANYFPVRGFQSLLLLIQPTRRALFSLGE